MAITLLPLSDEELAGFVKRKRQPGTWSNRDKSRHVERQKRLEETRLILALDGEGEDDTSTGLHHYTFLAASDATGEHTYSVRSNSLGSEQCFRFLMELPQPSLLVGFSFDYDINMMLRDLPLKYLQRLRDKKKVLWRNWLISWTPRKRFCVSRWDNKRKRTTKTVNIWDIFGYFQRSFVRTIWDWQVGSPEELRLVAEMKARRSAFNEEDNANIERYCLLECKLAAQTFHKLLTKTTEIGLKLQRYDGAGSVAAAMFHKHQVKNYLHQGENRLPDEVILSGYYGGRFDLTQYGPIGTATEHDINSAYPAVAQDLPCLAHSRWRPTTELTRWGIYFVEWQLTQDQLWAPFPYRVKGAIKYLANGSGWYWGREVMQAYTLYPGQIRVTNGYELVRECSHQPFAFIPEYYAYRKALQELGDLGEYVIKLGLNSLYGKLAQNKGSDDKIPANQCFIWAGIITSETRAKLLYAISQCPESIVLCATDAVISTTKLELTGGTNLGAWGEKNLRDLFIVQNGVYSSKGEKPKVATRGVSAKDLLDPENKVDEWSRIRLKATKWDQFIHEIKTRRFVALGRALQTNPPLKGWRTWQEEAHVIKYGLFPDKEFRDGRLFPAPNPSTEPSSPFNPRQYRADVVGQVGADLVDVLTEQEVYSR